MKGLNNEIDVEDLFEGYREEARNYGIASGEIAQRFETDADEIYKEV